MSQKKLESQLLEASVRRLDLSDYCVVTPSTTVRETVEQMRETRKHTAFIVGDHTVLQGILTDRDVLKKVASAPAALWEQPITDIMTPEPDTLPPTATAGDALRLMEAKRFRNVPIVNDKGTPIGNLTYSSLVSYLSEHLHKTVLNQPPTSDYAEQRHGG